MNNKVVESFRVKRKLLGGYIVIYKCPHCNEKLTSQESEIRDEEQCPECGMPFYISYKATQEIESLRYKGKKQRRGTNRENYLQPSPIYKLEPPNRNDRKEPLIDGFLDRFSDHQLQTLHYAFWVIMILTVIAIPFYLGPLAPSDKRTPKMKANEEFVDRKFRENGIQLDDDELRTVTRAIEKASKASDH